MMQAPLLSLLRGDPMTGSAPDSLAAAIDSARAADHAGDWGVALERYARALAEAHAAENAARASDALRWSGQIHLRRGSYDVAAEFFRQSRAAAESAHLLPQTASALNGLALVEQFQGRLARAEELYAQAALLADAAGDRRLGALVEQNLGLLANVRGDIEGALGHYRAALAGFDALGDEPAAARALHDVGMAHVDRSEWEEARRAYDRAWVLAERARDLETLGKIELARAELFLRQGDLAAARVQCDLAFELLGRLGSKSALAEAHKYYGIIYRELGQPVLADTHLELVIGIARECGDVLLEAEAEHERALVHLEEGRTRDALRSLSAAHRLYTQLEARRELGDVDRRLARLQESYLHVVRIWGESIESKDRSNAGHCRRVADYACMLAEEVGLAAEEMVWFRMGAFLHDVGKTVVPQEVLNKAGSLTPEEWEAMRRHPVEGDRILAELGFPWDMTPMVRHHHERWDGGGYPDGLKGEEIPLTARILCVADFYDALTTARSYRAAYPAEEALRMLDEDAGRLLDPELCEAFKRALQRRPRLAVA